MTKNDIEYHTNMKKGDKTYPLLPKQEDLILELRIGKKLKNGTLTVGYKSSGLQLLMQGGIP